MRFDENFFVWFAVKVSFALSMTLDFIGLDTSERHLKWIKKGDISYQKKIEMAWLSWTTSFHPRWFREASEGSVLLRCQRVPVVVALLASRGSQGGLCRRAKPTLQQCCAQAYPVPGAECSFQSSAERGQWGGCYAGLSQGRTAACEPTPVWMWPRRGPDKVTA